MQRFLIIFFTFFVAFNASAEGDNYTLFDAMQSTLLRNQQLKSLQEDVSKSKSEVGKSVTNFLPDVSLNRNETQTKYNNEELANQTTVEKKLAMNMVLYQNGGKFANFKANKDRMRATQHSYNAELQNILINTVDFYTQYLLNVEILRIAENRKKLLKNQLDLNQVKFDYGDIPKTDLLQAEAAYANSISDVETARGNVASSKAALEGATYDEYTPDKVKPVKHSIADHIMPTSLDELLAMLTLNNPNILSSKHLLSAAKAGLYLNTTNVLPRVTGRVEFFDRESESLTSQSTGSFKGSRAIVDVTIPILPNGGGGFFDVKKSYSEKKKAAANLDRTRNDVQSLAIRLWSQYKAAEALRVAALKTVNADRKTLEGFQEEARVGARDIIQVLEVEQRFFDSQIKYQRAIQQKIVSAFRILGLLGKLQNFEY